jgi:hypothetical protein
VEEFYAEGHSAVLADERRKDRTELRALEDEAILGAVRRQIDLGLDVVTDGEFRRWMFLNSFYDAVEGFRTDNVVRGVLSADREEEMIAARRRRFGPVTGQAVLVAAATQPTSPIESKTPTHMTSSGAPARATCATRRRSQPSFCGACVGSIPMGVLEGGTWLVRRTCA